MPDLRYPVLIEPVYVDGRIVEYSATPPDLPGCVGVGRTPESALRDVRIEIERWLMDCANRGLLIPPSTIGRTIGRTTGRTTGRITNG